MVIFPSHSDSTVTGYRLDSQGLIISRVREMDMCLNNLYIT